MDHKYSVPALDRAHAVLTLLIDEPYKWKLSDSGQFYGSQRFCSTI